jgi:hypothetical protein
VSTVDSPSLDCADLAEQLLENSEGAEQDPGSESNERRKNSRRNFGCWQLVAEYDGHKFPIQEDFQLRLFRDISEGGISFLADERPGTEDLIIALGAMPFVFFHVKFARATRRKDLEGQPLQIGCRFIKRLTF